MVNVLGRSLTEAVSFGEHPDTINREINTPLQRQAINLFLMKAHILSLMYYLLRGFSYKGTYKAIITVQVFKGKALKL